MTHCVLVQLSPRVRLLTGCGWPKFLHSALSYFWEGLSTARSNFISKPDEEKRGLDFSCSCMHLTITDLSTCSSVGEC